MYLDRKCFLSLAFKYSAKSNFVLSLCSVSSVIVRVNVPSCIVDESIQPYVTVVVGRVWLARRTYDEHEYSTKGD